MDNPDKELYQQVKETSLQDRFFKHSDVEKLLKDKSKSDLFRIKVAGYSEEKRPIYLLQAGTGEQKVLIWTQMHGNEPTGTAAVFDLLNYLQIKIHEPEVAQLLQKLSLFIVPMLNPDGAARFTRQNACGIDINRDAKAQISAESQVLIAIQKSLEARWAFNLHDQDTHYRVGKTDRPATISFLTPAFDESQSFDDNRRQSAQLMMAMTEKLEKFIPGCIGRYSDAYDPRCFGDHFQSTGMNTILIESGGAKNDPEKQVARAMNFWSLLAGLEVIVQNSFENYKFVDYEKIPLNRKDYFDLLVRNLEIREGDKKVVLDLGILRRDKKLSVYHKTEPCSLITDKGDLSVYHGYDEIDAAGAAYAPGKVYTRPFDTPEAVEKMQDELITAGYTAVYATTNFDVRNSVRLKIKVLVEHTMYLPKPHLNQCADFVIIKNGRIKFSVIDGFLFDVNI